MMTMLSEKHRSNSVTIGSKRTGNYTGRISLDPKPNAIRVRINDATLEWLQEKSTTANRSVSDIVREFILEKMQFQKNSEK